MEELLNRKREVSEVVELIRSTFIPKDVFTADDVYSHEQGVADLDMYWALSILKVKGEIEPLFDDSSALTHTEMVYRRRNAAVPRNDGERGKGRTNKGLTP
tara:strand:- start:8860 stop:9162 length:303 start_codon:yes stop_codon:yes gene_type:complete